jgi:hypothetical protein
VTSCWGLAEGARFTIRLPVEKSPAIDIVPPIFGASRENGGPCPSRLSPLPIMLSTVALASPMVFVS